MNENEQEKQKALETYEYVRIYEIFMHENRIKRMTTATTATSN